MGKHTKVVKVPVRIVEPDKDILRLKYAVIREMMSEARYLANMAVRRHVSLRDHDVPNPTKEDGTNIPPDTVVCRLLSSKRKLLIATSVAKIGRMAGKKFCADNKEAWAGRKSLPTYRSRFLPFRSKRTVIDEDTSGKVPVFSIRASCFKSRPWITDEFLDMIDAERERCNLRPIVRCDIPDDRRMIFLDSCFSWKDKGAISVVSRIVGGEYKLCDSELKQDKDGKIFALLSYSFESKPVALDPAKVCGVDLGVSIPAVCGTNFNYDREYLGNGQEVWAVRSKYRARRRRMQKRAGNGSVKDIISNSEQRWIRTYYHTLTASIIKFCVKSDCGTIHVEDLTSLRDRQKDDEYQRLMWCPSMLVGLLTQKANEIGVKVVKVNPRNSSRRCSWCGRVSKDNRKTQKDFHCVECDKSANADYNAARNIASATGDAIANGWIDHDKKCPVVVDEGCRVVLKDGNQIFPEERPVLLSNAV